MENRDSTAHMLHLQACDLNGAVVQCCLLHAREACTCSMTSRALGYCTLTATSKLGWPLVALCRLALCT